MHVVQGSQHSHSIVTLQIKALRFYVENQVVEFQIVERHIVEKSSRNDILSNFLFVEMRYCRTSIL
jgi:hypothetical protein